MPRKIKKQSTASSTPALSPRRPVPNPAYGLPLILLLLVTALMVGGMFTFWRASILDDARREMDARYEKLMTELQTQPIPTAASGTTPQPPAEDPGPINSDTANTTVEYKNIEKGLASISLPYNELWGNNLFKVAPFDETPDGVVGFGPHQPFVVPQRLASLTFLPARTSAAAMRAASAQVLNGDGSEPILRIFPSVTYVKYSVGELPTQDIVEVIGIKANYRLTSYVSSFGDRMAELERIARSIKFAK